MYTLAPPRHLVEELRRYDPALNLRFHAGRCRWCVTRMAKAWVVDEDTGLGHEEPREVHIFDIQEPDGSFRPPDRRIMRQLYYGDLWRIGADAAADLIEESERREAEAKETARREEMIAVTQANEAWLTGTRWQTPQGVKKFQRGLRNEFGDRFGTEGSI